MPLRPMTRTRKTEPKPKPKPRQVKRQRQKEAMLPPLPVFPLPEAPPPLKPEG